MLDERNEQRFRELVRGIMEERVGSVQGLRTWIAELLKEKERLEDWLLRIEGGDSPCQDEAVLRRWAYQAVTNRREAAVLWGRRDTSTGVAELEVESSGEKTTVAVGKCVAGVVLEEEP